MTSFMILLYIGSGAQHMRRAHEKIRKKYHKDTKHMFEKPNDRIGAWSAAGEYGGEYVRRYIT